MAAVAGREHRPVRSAAWAAAHSLPLLAALPGGKTIRYRTVAGGTGRRGEALWDLLDAAVRARDIPVRFETAAERLVIADDGSVTGLAVSDGERPVTLGANRGVVLACGGIGADPGLADAYLPLGPSWPVGHPGNTGAGLLMAQQAGAALWHMYGCFGWFAFRTPEFPAPFALDFFGASHLLVDGDGHRFADETGYEVHDRLRALLSYLPRNPNRPRLPGWAVFDEAARLAGPLNGLLGTPNEYAWSPDLARRRGHHRRPRHDEQARVLRPDGRPIPGLYAAGAVSLVWGHLIEHGGGLTDAIVFGRIAGEQAAHG